MAKFFSSGNKITSFGSKFNYGTNADGDCCCGPVEGDSIPTFMPGWNVQASLGAGSFKFKLPIRAKKDGQYYGNKFRGWLKCSFSRSQSNWASKITLPAGKTAYETPPTSWEMFTDEELAIPEGDTGYVKTWNWDGTYWSESMGTPSFGYRETLGYLEGDKDWSECDKKSDTAFGFYFRTYPEGCDATPGTTLEAQSKCEWVYDTNPSVSEDLQEKIDCYFQCYTTEESCDNCVDSGVRNCFQRQGHYHNNWPYCDSCWNDAMGACESAYSDCMDNGGDEGQCADDSSECERNIVWDGYGVDRDGCFESGGDGSSDSPCWEWQTHACHGRVGQEPDWWAAFAESANNCDSTNLDDILKNDGTMNKTKVACGCGEFDEEVGNGSEDDFEIIDCGHSDYLAGLTPPISACGRGSYLRAYDAYSENTKSNVTMPSHCKSYSCIANGEEDLDPRADTMTIPASKYGCSGNIINNISMGFRVLSSKLLFSDQGLDSLYDSASNCSYSTYGTDSAYHGNPDFTKWACDCTEGIVERTLYEGSSCEETDWTTCPCSDEDKNNVGHTDYNSWNNLKDKTDHAKGLFKFLPYSVSATPLDNEGCTLFGSPGTSKVYDITHSRLCFAQSEIRGMFGYYQHGDRDWQTWGMNASAEDVKSFAEKAMSYVNSGGGAKESEEWPKLDDRTFKAPTKMEKCNEISEIKCEGYNIDDVDREAESWYWSNVPKQGLGRNIRLGAYFPKKWKASDEVHGHTAGATTVWWSDNTEDHWYMDHPNRKTDGCQQDYMTDNYYHPDIWHWPHYEYVYPSEKDNDDNAIRPCPLSSNEEDCFEWEINLTDKFYTGTAYSTTSDETLKGGLTCSFPYGAGLKKIGDCPAKPAEFENHLPEEFGGDGIIPGRDFYIWIDGEDEIEFTVDCPWSAHYINKLIAAEHLTRIPWMDGCYIEGTGGCMGADEFDNLITNNDYYNNNPPINCQGNCSDPVTSTQAGKSLNPNTSQWSFSVTPYVQDNGGPGWKCKPARRWDDEESPWFNGIEWDGSTDCEMPIHPDFNFDTDCSRFRSWDDFQSGKVRGGYSEPINKSQCCGTDNNGDIVDCDEWDEDIEMCREATRDESLDSSCEYYESHSPHVCCTCREHFPSPTGPLFVEPPYFCVEDKCKDSDYACSEDGGDTRNPAAGAEDRCPD